MFLYSCEIKCSIFPQIACFFTLFLRAFDVFRIIISIYTHFIYVMIEQFRDVTCIPPRETAQNRRTKKEKCQCCCRIFIKSICNVYGVGIPRIKSLMVAVAKLLMSNYIRFTTFNTLKKNFQRETFKSWSRFCTEAEYMIWSLIIFLSTESTNLHAIVFCFDELFSIRIEL